MLDNFIDYVDEFFCYLFELPWDSVMDCGYEPLPPGNTKSSKEPYTASPYMDNRPDRFYSGFL